MLTFGLQNKVVLFIWFTYWYIFKKQTRIHLDERDFACSLIYTNWVDSLK